MAVRSEVVEYRGRQYRRYPDSPHHSDRTYFKAVNPVSYLHRDMWAAEVGPIPEGLEVHHRDGNGGNNVLPNFELVSRADHMRRHRKPGSRTTFREGRRAERERGARPTWHRPCDHCGEFFGDHSGRMRAFCRNACKSAARRAARSDDVDRPCEVCEQPFRVNRYEGRRYCSAPCRRRVRFGTSGGV